MQFDYMNDIHLDFWVPFDKNQIKFQKKTEAFALSLVPNSPSKILLIGGDLGHFNLQNFWFLKTLSSIYKQILLVFGNHDYYLISSNQKNKYKKSSIKRINEMLQLTETLPVTYLQGDTFEFDGITFGGTGMWYDFQYGIQVDGKTEDQVYADWVNNSRDFKRISGFTTKDKFKSEISNLHQIINKSDVILSHVGPDWRFSPYKSEKKVHNSYYFFDGSSFRDSMRDKYWCFGHVHMELDMEYDDCRFISYGLGYPDEGEQKIFKQIII